jgi:putative lipoprotein
MRQAVLSLLVAVAVMVLAACGAGETIGTVSGTVTYAERIHVRPDAVMRVRLLDVSDAQARPVALAEHAQATGGTRPPFRFELEFDGLAIDDGGLYVLEATLEADGRTLLRTPTAIPVITRGQPSEHVQLVLRSL